MSQGLRMAITLAGLLIYAGAVSAEVERVEVRTRREVRNGESFGAAGAYEAVTGTVHFVIDPAHPGNGIIPDLARAPRDAQGRVHASADFSLLRPKDPARGNHVLLFDVANRGTRIALRTLHRPAAPDTPEPELGDAFLLRQGYTVLWVGWQGDLPGDRDMLRADLPRAVGIEGMMRGDFTLLQDAPQTAVPGAGLNLPLERAGPEDRLFVRDDPYSDPRLVPRDRWRFSEDRRHLIADDGLKAGKVYDLMFRAKDPLVAGLGFAAVRDAVSAARAGRFPDVAVSKTIGFGVSQSGRMLRDFLYQGFNVDEGGARVFDGLMIHIAGGARGSFTQRFAASGSDTYFYPSRFPFTPEEQTDPVTGLRDGLLNRARADRVVPLIFFTNSAVEYWGGRGASLTHTTVDGARDLAPGENARIYFMAGQQHVPAAFPPKRSAASLSQQLPNPLDAEWALRGLLSSMREWIENGTKPPDSRYPRIADGTLVAPVTLRFPKALGPAPTMVPLNMRLDLGPDYIGKGIAVLPAKVGAPFRPLVPAVDADGNDATGVRMPELAAPLATYTGWNFRDPSTGSPQSFVRLVGSYVPFALTRAEREASGDTRLSIEERYGSQPVYLTRVRDAAERLAADGFLLKDDTDAIVDRAAEHWTWLHRRAVDNSDPR